MGYLNIKISELLYGLEMILNRLLSSLIKNVHVCMLLYLFTTVFTNITIIKRYNSKRIILFVSLNPYSTTKYYID